MQHCGALVRHFIKDCFLEQAESSDLKSVFNWSGFKAVSIVESGLTAVRERQKQAGLRDMEEIKESN